MTATNKTEHLCITVYHFNAYFLFTLTIQQERELRVNFSLGVQIEKGLQTSFLELPHIFIT